MTASAPVTLTEHSSPLALVPIVPGVQERLSVRAVIEGHLLVIIEGTTGSGWPGRSSGDNGPPRERSSGGS
ncbi:MAG: hypothetical protein AB1486_33750, partial [Planctomycetota bacterium]